MGVVSHTCSQQLPDYSNHIICNLLSVFLKEWRGWYIQSYTFGGWVINFSIFSNFNILLKNNVRDLSCLPSLSVYIKTFTEPVSPQEVLFL